MEFWFYYGEALIDIAFHYESQKKIYELNISNGEKAKCYTFDTIEELVYSKVFDDKSLYDIWDDLEN